MYREAHRNSSASAAPNESPSRELVNPMLGLVGSSLTGPGPKKAVSAHAGVKNDSSQPCEPNGAWCTQLALARNSGYIEDSVISSRHFPMGLNLGSLLLPSQCQQAVC